MLKKSIFCLLLIILIVSGCSTPGGSDDYFVKITIGNDTYTLTEGSTMETVPYAWSYDAGRWQIVASADATLTYDAVASDARGIKIGFTKNKTPIYYADLHHFMFSGITATEGHGNAINPMTITITNNTVAELAGTFTGKMWMDDPNSEVDASGSFRVKKTAATP